MTKEELLEQLDECKEMLAKIELDYHERRYREMILRERARQYRDFIEERKTYEIRVEQPKVENDYDLFD